MTLIKSISGMRGTIGGEGNEGIAKSKMTSTELGAKHPDYKIVKDKIEVKGISNLDPVLERIRRKFIDYPCDTIDGLEITFPDGWLHLSKSNAESIICIYAEAKTQEYALDLVECVKQLVKINT